MTEEVKAWWEATADCFQDDVDLDVGINWTGFLREELDVLDDVSGLDVLELGCGGGQCSVALANRGANVTGLDLSVAQLAHARELGADHDADVEWLEGDVTDLSRFPDESFDLAFNAWVFQWVDDLPACFAETHRVLRPGGQFVFSMPHPYYQLLDPESHVVTESYFDTGRHVAEQPEMDLDMVTYRHTVSGVYQILVGAGFRVDSLREPGSVDPADYEKGPWGKHTPELMSKAPMVLLVEATKPQQ